MKSLKRSIFEPDISSSELKLSSSSTSTTVFSLLFLLDLLSIMASFCDFLVGRGGGVAYFFFFVGLDADLVVSFLLHVGVVEARAIKTSTK